MANECALTIKKVHFESKERNSPESITARFNWVSNLWQSMSITKAIVFSLIRLLFITIWVAVWLGLQKGLELLWFKDKSDNDNYFTRNFFASSTWWGECPMKRAPRKVKGESKAKKTVGTVLGHCFDFISAALDILDRHEQSKDIVLSWLIVLYIIRIRLQVADMNAYIFHPTLQGLIRLSRFDL